MPKPAKYVQPIHFEDFDGSQFERLVFAYHARVDRWRSLEWYGQGGSDLGRDIWGIRDDDTRNGESVCIQCVNRKNLTFAKAKEDISKVLTLGNGVPKRFRIVARSNVSAEMRDKIKNLVKSIGVNDCDIWSGVEFEEFLRRGAESLLKRFVEGEAFPDTPSDLQTFAQTPDPVNDDAPLPADLAAATVKRYLIDSTQKIALFDFVTEETERVVPLLSISHYPAQEDYTRDELAARLRRYEADIDTLRAILMTGCYWGNAEQTGLWSRVLERVANTPETLGGDSRWSRFPLYPALFLMYAAGLAATVATVTTAANAYETLYALLIKARVRDSWADGWPNFPLATVVNVGASIVPDASALNEFARYTSSPTALSQYLLTRLREPFRELLPHDGPYENCFDRFEFMVALVCVDLTNDMDGAPLGSFVWRGFDPWPMPADISISREAHSAGESWAPLRAGFFGNSIKRFWKVKDDFTKFVALNYMP